MSEAMRLRLAASVAFALLTVMPGWAVTWLLGLASDGLTQPIALTLAVSAGAWAYVVNNLEPAAPKAYAINALQYRPILLSFSLFIALIIVWGVTRAVVEWVIEPNMYNYGTCGKFYYGPCGEQDLNGGRRYLATDLLDKIVSGLFLLVPFSLATNKIRSVFQ